MVGHRSEGLPALGTRNQSERLHQDTEQKIQQLALDFGYLEEQGYQSLLERYLTLVSS